MEIYKDYSHEINRKNATNLQNNNQSQRWIFQREKSVILHNLFSDVLLKIIII